jgi:hypothetical protein
MQVKSVMMKKMVCNDGGVFIAMTENVEYSCNDERRV